MRKSDARTMLNTAFGPGDLAKRIEQDIDAGRIEPDNIPEEVMSELMDWMAEQLADEEEPENPS